MSTPVIPKNIAADDLRVLLKLDMSGRNVLVTGANAGLGKETARVLARANANVFLACRDEVKCTEAANEIQKEIIALKGSDSQGATLHTLKLDLASFSSIRNFAKEWYKTRVPLHVLVNNAGVAACPPSLTEDGIELQYGVNYLGHFLLTNLLLDSLEKGGASRVVNLSSELHYHIPFDLEKAGTLDVYKVDNGFLCGPHWTGYGVSKNAMILSMLAFNKRLRERQSAVTINALQPGFAASTDMVRHLPFTERWFNRIASAILGKTIGQASSTMIYVAAAPDLNGTSGKYYDNCQERVPAPFASDPTMAEKLWELSAQQCKLDDAMADLRTYREANDL